jgi:hypothetical protein
METRASLVDNYVVSIILCLLVLVAIFNHWGWPLVILTSVPLGIAGGIGGLARGKQCRPRLTTEEPPRSGPGISIGRIGCGRG